MNDVVVLCPVDTVDNHVKPRSAARVGSPIGCGQQRGRPWTAGGQRSASAARLDDPRRKRPQSCPQAVYGGLSQVCRGPRNEPVIAATAQGWCSRSPAGLALDPVGELADLGVDRPALGHQRRGSCGRRASRWCGRGRRTPAPILGSDRSVSSRHRYIATCRAWTSTRLREEPHRSSIEIEKYAAVCGHDRRRGDLRAGRVGDQVLEHDLGQGEVDGLPVEAGERGDPDQRAFELADVATRSCWR